ncbi:MAG: class I SAM-dependent methyltransferase [Pseudomonadota bacterium]
MNLADLGARPAPQPWSGTHKIPWQDPAVSRRMLAQHLDPSHDRASRPPDVIQRQIDFITRDVLAEPGRVLDLGCGPGLYCGELKRRGYRCAGVDISPAAIEYARTHDPDSEYRLADFMLDPLGQGYELAMLLYGEFHTFPPSAAQALLARMKDAVFPGGAVILEVQSSQRILSYGNQPSSWRAASTSVFGDEPHLWLSEYFWYEQDQVAIARHFVVEESHTINEYIDTQQGYAEHELVEMFQALGFRRIARQPSLSGEPGYFFLIGFC